MRTKEQTETVSFRLPAGLYARLTESAEPLGLSAGEQARRLVMEALSDNRYAALEQSVSDLRQTTDRLREDLATVAAALLAKDGPVSAAEAKVWARKTLLT